MTNYYERLTECAELLHDEGFDRRESPIVDVIAARDEIERLRAALEAKAEPPQPAALVEAWDDEIETATWHAFDSVEAANRFVDESEAPQLYVVNEWTWHPKSPREHPAE